MSSRLSLLRTVFFTATTLGIIIYTFWLTWHYSFNFAIGSDEAAYILQSSTEMVSASNVQEFLSAFWQHHGQHMLFGMQLANLLSLLTTGMLSFRLINTFAVMVLCAGGLFFIRAMRPTRAQAVLLAAIVYPLLLSPMHNECMLVAACTNNHYFGLSVSLTALYLLSGALTPTRFIVGEIMVALSVFSFASGLVVPLVTLLPLLYTASQRRWFMAHIALSVLYYAFYAYVTYPLPETIWPPHDNAGEIALSAAYLLIYTSGLIGTFFMWLLDQSLPFQLPLAGLLIAITCSYACYRQGATTRHQTRFFWQASLLFLLMLGTITAGRFFGQYAARYSVYSVFMMIPVILALLQGKGIQEQQSLRWHTAAALLALVHYSISWHYNQALPGRLAQTSAICVKHWYEKKPLNSPEAHCTFLAVEQDIVDIMRAAEAKGIYRPDNGIVEKPSSR